MLIIKKIIQSYMKIIRRSRNTLYDCLITCFCKSVLLFSHDKEQWKYNIVEIKSASQEKVIAPTSCHIMVARHAK